MDVKDAIQCYILCYFSILLNALRTWHFILCIVMIGSFIAAMFFDSLFRYFTFVAIALSINVFISGVFFAKMMSNDQDRQELEGILKRFKSIF
jgi:hypothetical protein